MQIQVLQATVLSKRSCQLLEMEREIVDLATKVLYILIVPEI